MCRFSSRLIAPMMFVRFTSRSYDLHQFFQSELKCFFLKNEKWNDFVTSIIQKCQALHTSYYIMLRKKVLGGSKTKFWCLKWPSKDSFYQGCRRRRRCSRRRARQCARRPARWPDWPSWRPSWQFFCTLSFWPTKLAAITADWTHSA